MQMSRGNMHQIAKMVDWKDEDSNDFFSDSEELNALNKYETLQCAISSEIDRVRKDNLLYWESLDGTVKEIAELNTRHLCCLPRHLYNTGRARSKEDVPKRIVDVLNSRGFKVLDNCVVVKALER